jgi:hypothetical protein
LGYEDPEHYASYVIRQPKHYYGIINIARRLAELAPHLYPADPDPITLAVREIRALECEASFAAQRAVIEKLIEEIKS